MPVDITLTETRIGYSTGYARTGENLALEVRGFSTTEDGNAFIKRLEGFPSQILALLPMPIPPSLVDHMLVIIRRHKSDRPYVNELIFKSEVRLKRDVKAGEPVLKDDVYEVRSLTFEGVSIPNDAGYMFMFSKDWRKGLDFDFAPLHDEMSDRVYDVNEWLGRCISYLDFEHLFSLTDNEWKVLLNQQWFPFISLKADTITSMTNYLRAGWSVDDLLETIANEVATTSQQIVERCSRNPLFAEHTPFIERAVERYLAQDYISANSILYPRIEGLMRSRFMQLHGPVNPNERIGQGRLVTAVIDDPKTDKRTLLLPENFDQYLREVYFKGFDPNNPDIISRHSVSHGVALANLYDRKGAAIGLLIADQLAFYLQT